MKTCLLFTGERYNKCPNSHSNSLNYPVDPTAVVHRFPAEHNWDLTATTQIVHIVWENAEKTLGTFSEI